MWIGGEIGFRLLNWIHPVHKSNQRSISEYTSSREKIDVMYGRSVFEAVKNKTIVDYGSGTGGEAIEFALAGASHVLGVEIQQRFRQQANQRAIDAGISDKCEFFENPKDKADIVFSLDTFEHFDDPSEILVHMKNIMHDESEAWISFSWTWYHPYGGHFFSVFPWAHLFFSEACLIRWRSQFKSDGAKRFREVEGGLNQLTIKKFIAYVQSSPLEMTEFSLTPIRSLRWIHCRLTREFTTSLVHAKLKLRK